jgi:uncharacterized protein (TIGR00290 family)
MSKILMNWSSGKDSAYALYKLLQNPAYEVPYLLTSVNQHYERVSMHGVRTLLLEQQAQRLGIPLLKLELPESPSMEEYNARMTAQMNFIQQQGIELAAFGDIFLEDLRQYREAQLAKIKMQGVFPLWKIPSQQLIEEILALGFRAMVVCVHAKYLGEEFVGREIDADFLADLPKNVDVCGENGEFHTFVFDAPMFSAPIPFTLGETVYREYPAPNAVAGERNGFYYCDLLPVTE